MQRKNIETLKTNLLSHLDKDCNVLSVEGALAAVIELIEHPTTQDELEQTRLGKYVNEFRKKTSHTELSRKAKELLKKYQLIVNQAAVSSSVRKKDVPLVKNGIHAHGSSSPAVPNNTSRVPDGSDQLNGRLKNVFTKSSSNLAHEVKVEKLKQVSSGKGYSSSNDLRSQQTSIILKNGFLSNNSESLKKQVNSPHVLPKAASVSQFIPKDVSVMNGNVSPIVSNSCKNVCDKVVRTSKKRHLDVPSTSSENAAKRIKLENSHHNVDSTLARNKVSNGVSSDKGAKSKVFSCKVSSDDLKCTIRSEPVKPISCPSKTTSPHSVKSTSSSVIKHDPAKSDHTVNKLRSSKVETTQQLLQKLQMNGELCLIPSPTIYKIANNQIVKEHIEDSSVVPTEIRIKSHRKGNKLQPPSSSHDMAEIKNELVQKFLRTSVDHNHVPSFAESPPELKRSPEIRDCKVESLNRSGTKINSKLDPNSEEYKRELLKNPWAFLPPLETEKIHYDEEPFLPKQNNEPCQDYIDKLLHGRWPGVNGQFGFTNHWEPWTKTYSMKSVNDSYLHILPYVNLD